jgi:hypothetical protein
MQLLDHLVGAARAPAIRPTGVTEYWSGIAASHRLDVGRLDHLAPSALAVLRLISSW